MNKFLKTLFLVFIICFPGKGITMDVSAEVKGFHSPQGAFAEVSIYILGSSLVPFKTSAGLKEARVEILLTIKKGDVFVKADRYNLISPTDSIIADLIDVKRFVLDNGDYELQLSLTDLGDSTNQIDITRTFTIMFDDNKLDLSDIQLLAAAEKSESEGILVKNGIYMEPLPFRYYHRNLQKLIAYFEVYRIHQLPAGRYFITYSILEQNQNEAVRQAHKMLESVDIQPFILQMDISDIKSGNYRFRVEVKNESKEVLASRESFFQSSNPELDLTILEGNSNRMEESFVQNIAVSQLRYDLKAIAPVVAMADVEVLNYVIENGSEKSKRFFLYRFWSDENAQSPETAYQGYMEVARAVDNMYASGFGYGFETDRGFIYMKYGRPDDIVSVEDEPSAPPYEIWFYNTFPATHQQNVRFIFYNPSLANNDFNLLHSTAIGELKNPRWEVDLYKSAPGDIDGANYIDAKGVTDGYNRNARRYFEGN